MMQLEKGGYAIYIGMKIVLAIGAGIVIGIASSFSSSLFAIPVDGVVSAVIFGGKCGGFILECVHHYGGHRCRLRAVRCVFLPDCSDLGAGDRFLPSLFDLLFRGALSAAECLSCIRFRRSQLRIFHPPDLPPLPPYPQPAS